MAGRKRKLLALEETAAPGKDVNKRENKTDLNVSLSELKRACSSENDRSAEAEQSRYFVDNYSHCRLGGDFFNQPCISLAKALLGKVSLHCVKTILYYFKLSIRLPVH